MKILFTITIIIVLINKIVILKWPKNETVVKCGRRSLASVERMKFITKLSSNTGA